MPKVGTKAPATPDKEETAGEEPKKAERAKAEPKKKSRLLAQATRLGEQREIVNGLWAGDAGTGKTSCLASMANLGRTIVINAEGGIKKRPLEMLGVNTDLLEILPADPADLSDVYLTELFWELKAELEQDPNSIAGVVWDSVTEIHVQILRNVVDYQLARAEARSVSRIKDAEPGDMINQHFTDLADYGIMTSQMRVLLRKYRDLPCHFAVSALLRRDKDDDGKVVYRPAVTPALQKDLEAFMDVVCVTSVTEMPDGGDDEYRGLFRPVGKFRGKDRFGATPKILIDPSFERVAQYVNDELDLESDPVMKAARQRHAELGLIRGKKAVEEVEEDVADEPDEDTTAE